MFYIETLANQFTIKLDLLDHMHPALIDLLIEEAIITEEEYEKRVKGKIRIKQKISF